jgi:hypothetical protein
MARGNANKVTSHKVICKILGLLETGSDLWVVRHVKAAVLGRPEVCREDFFAFICVRTPPLRTEGSNLRDELLLYRKAKLCVVLPL